MHPLTPLIPIPQTSSPSTDSTQYTDGISSSLVVHPTAPPPPNLPKWDDELVVMMSDWYHDMSEDLLAQYLSVRGELLALRGHDICRVG
jgi:FtsP/CotA-like multicopper oxidase with cupredoxin domain